MAVNNMILLTRIAGYVIGLVLSLCIVVPMSLNQVEFDGNCVLFSQGTWEEGAKMMSVSWAPPSYCHYVLFVGIATMITCCLQVYRFLSLWVDGRDSSFLSSFLEAVGCLLLSGLLLSSGVIVTYGFMTWCDSVSQWFPSCQDLAGESISQVHESTEWFYVEIDITQLGTWALFATLVGGTVASALKCLHEHQLRNLHAVARASVAGETSPLLNSGWPEHGRPVAPAPQQP